MKFSTAHQYIISTVLFFLFLFTEKLNGQTFITGPYYPSIYGHAYDTLDVGPLSFARSIDGYIFSIVQIDQDRSSQLIKYDSLGNEIFNITATLAHTLSIETPTDVHSTPDSSCVFGTVNVFSFYWVSKVFKINSSGGLVWMKDYNPNHLSTSPYIMSVQSTYYNTTIVQYLDTIEELDNSGNVIQIRSAFQKQFITIPDSEIIAYLNDTITRESFSGIVKWTTYGKGNVFHADSDYFYTKSSDTITKYSTNNGSLLWQKIIPASTITVKSDGGFMTSGTNYNFSNDICSYDSSGNLIWCKTIDFPLNGYRKIIECTPDNFFIGGAFPIIEYQYLFLLKSWGPFIASIDSSGNGVIDSTNQFMMGNANDNSVFSFADDAPFIAAAMGNTGIPRCETQIDTTTYPNTYFRSCFCTNWTGQFGSGINYKYSDINGSGIIDTIDLLPYQALAPTSLQTIPHWRGPSANTQNTNISLTFGEDSVLAGDSVTIYVILGNQGIQIDSIYSFALTMSSQNLFFNGGHSLTIPTNDFGDPSIDLFKYAFIRPLSDYYNLLLCKTDHQNVSMYSDTVAILRIPTFAGMSPRFYSLSAMASAITKEGFQIGLNIVRDSIYYSDPTVSINEPLNHDIKIYPNPASDFLNVELKSEKPFTIKIVSLTGQKLSSLQSNGNIRINIESLREGTYFLIIESEEYKIHQMFTVSR